MSTGSAIGITIALVLVTAVTAGFWLNLLMWIPMVLLGQLRDEGQALVWVTTLTMAVAALTVFLVGMLALGLPLLAAAIAGVLVGMTSYARPNTQPA